MRRNRDDNLKDLGMRIREMTTSGALRTKMIGHMIGLLLKFDEARSTAENVLHISERLTSGSKLSM